MQRSKEIMSVTFALVVSALLAVGCGAPTSAGSNSALFVEAAHDPATCPTIRTFRCRTVTVNFDVLEASIKAGPGSHINVNPFEDAVFDAVLQTVEDSSGAGLPGAKSWGGTLRGYEHTTVGFTFSVARKRCVGDIWIQSTYPRNYFNVAPLADGSGRHLVKEFDPRGTPAH